MIKKKKKKKKTNNNKKQQKFNLNSQLILALNKSSYNIDVLSFLTTVFTDTLYLINTDYVDLNIFDIFLF